MGEKMAIADPVFRSPLSTQLRLRANKENFDERLFATPLDDDTLRILVPAQKKLSTIESQRILTLVDETTKRLEAALSIPLLASSLERFSIQLGSELVQLLQEFQQITSEYGGMLHSPSFSLKPVPSGSGSQSTSSDLNLSRALVPINMGMDKRLLSLRQHLRQNVKSTLRAMSANWTVLDSLGKERAMSHGAVQLTSAMKDLRVVLNEMLLTTKTEEVKRADHLQLVAQRRLSAEELIQNLEAQLEIAEEQKEEAVSKTTYLLVGGWLLKSPHNYIQVSERHTQIKELHKNIKLVEKSARDSNKKVKTEAEKQQSHAQRAFTTTKTKLEEEVTTLKKQLQDTVTENKAQEQEMMKVTKFSTKTLYLYCSSLLL